MSERFFSSHPILADRVTLDGPEAHHLIHVMRADAGREITLFDGTGVEFAAVVESVRRSEVEARIVERREVERELACPLTVGVALPKGDRQKWLVEKLTELGVATLVPLVTERGVAQPVDAARERLQRAVIEASKQCGRNRLMQIAGPQAWGEWISQAHPDARRLLAHPGGRPLPEIALDQTAPVQLAIGPEGGLSETEVGQAIDAGWQAVDLGPRILRVETAAVALAAVVALR
jgi:16S rRNA (uracil1498-N3)-methyltransferase